MNLRKDHIEGTFARLLALCTGKGPGLSRGTESSARSTRGPARVFVRRWAVQSGGPRRTGPAPLCAAAAAGVRSPARFFTFVFAPVDSWKARVVSFEEQALWELALVVKHNFQRWTPGLVLR